MMKTTELKRKTPLKPGQFKKKPPGDKKARTKGTSRQESDPETRARKKTKSKGLKARRQTFRSKAEADWTNTDWSNCCDLVWAFAVKTRDGWVCKSCGKSREAGYQLHAHHYINKQSKFFRHNLTNGVCLCASCHTLEGKFSAHMTPHKFDAWAKDGGIDPEVYAW